MFPFAISSLALPIHPQMTLTCPGLLARIIHSGCRALGPGQFSGLLAHRLGPGHQQVAQQVPVIDDCGDCIIQACAAKAQGKNLIQGCLVGFFCLSRRRWPKPFPRRRGVEIEEFGGVQVEVSQVARIHHCIRVCSGLQNQLQLVGRCREILVPLQLMQACAHTQELQHLCVACASGAPALPQPLCRSRGASKGPTPRLWKTLGSAHIVGDQGTVAMRG